MRTHVYRTVDDKSHAFPMLRVEDVIEMAERAFAVERAELVADLDECGITGEPRLERLRELALMRGRASVLIRYAYSYSGALEVLKMCRGRMTDPPPGDTFGLNPIDATRLALDLVGFTLDEDKPGDTTTNGAAAADDDDAEITGVTERPTTATPP